MVVVESGEVVEGCDVTQILTQVQQLLVFVAVEVRLAEGTDLD